MRPSRCREEFLNRVKSNEAAKAEAKKKGGESMTKGMPVVSLLEGSKPMLCVLLVLGRPFCIEHWPIVVDRITSTDKLALIIYHSKQQLGYNRKL